MSTWGNVCWSLLQMLPLSLMIFLEQGVHQQKPPCVLPLALLRRGCERHGPAGSTFLSQTQNPKTVSNWYNSHYLSPLISALQMDRDYSHPKHFFAISPQLLPCFQWITSPLLPGVWHRALCQVLSHLPCEASLADFSQEIQGDETALHITLLF